MIKDKFGASECIDNFKVDITARSSESLLQSIMLATANHQTITHFKVIDMKPEGLGCIEKSVVPTLVLYWTDGTKGIRKFRGGRRGPRLAGFVLKWLNDIWDKKEIVGEEPDIDGSCFHGFRVFCENWGHVGNDRHAVFAVQPVWGLCGK